MINAIVLNPVINNYNNKNYIEYRIIETSNLAEAINIKVLHQETFSLKKPDPGNLFRKGRIECIKNTLNYLSENSKVDIIIFCIDLSPIQQINENTFYSAHYC